MLNIRFENREICEICEIYQICENEENEEKRNSLSCVACVCVCVWMCTCMWCMWCMCMCVWCFERQKTSKNIYSSQPNKTSSKCEVVAPQVFTPSNEVGRPQPDMISCTVVEHVSSM
eukprot:m.256762 g.256762  ORF g.256762 m.256762 type:complete len:117 (+) comp34672_c0_seq1:27-377(+)